MVAVQFICHALCVYCVANACLISKCQTVIGMLRFLPLALVDQEVQEAPQLQLHPWDQLGPACEEITITTFVNNRDIQMNTMMEPFGVTQAELKSG